MRSRNGTRSRTRGAVAVACAVFLLAGGLGTSAGADEPDVIVFHGLEASTGFEEFDGCPVIMGPDAAGPALCLRLDVSGPLNFGDVDADVDPPMTIIVGIRAGSLDGTIPPVVVVAPGEDSEPERVEGGLLGFEELAELFDPVDDVAEDVAGAPVYNFYADADIADPDAQIDEMVEAAVFFPIFAGFVGVEEDEEISVEDFYALFGSDAEEFLGDQTIGLPISVQLRNLLLGDNCYIGTPDDRININLTTGETEPPEGVDPMTGDYGSFVYNVPDEDRPFSFISRIVRSGFVDNTFPVPGASGCDAVVGGLLGQDQGLFDPVINHQAGLPSEAGNNVADFRIDFAVAWTNDVYERSWSATPDGFDFGEVAVGESSAPETIVIENTGDRPTLFGSPLFFGGGSSHFTVDENTCTGEILDVGDQCELTLRGTPQSSGTHTGELVWSASAAGDGAGSSEEPVIFTVTGTE